MHESMHLLFVRTVATESFIVRPHASEIGVRAKRYRPTLERRQQGHLIANFIITDHVPLSHGMTSLDVVTSFCRIEDGVPTLMHPRLIDRLVGIL